MKKIWMTVPALLSLSLVACGGGGGTSTTAPAPAPGAVTSSVSGLLSLPGALPGTQTTASQAAYDFGGLKLLSGHSWWTSPAQVRARQQAAGIPESGVIPGEYIVRRRSGVVASQSLSAGGVTLNFQRSLGLPGLALYKTGAGGLGTLSLSSLQSALEARPDVAYAEPNRWYHAFAAPNDKLYPLQWDAQAMNLPTAWNTTTGKAVTVGVVDTGIVQHPDLLPKILPGLDLVTDGTPNTFDTDPTDEGGTEYHGSHVSGTVAAATNNAQGIAGVSWGAKILPVRVLGKDGGSSANILIGTLWAAGYDFTKQGLPANPNPARVINLSLGGQGACSQSEQDVFDYLAQQGVIVVAAAGNEDQDATNSSPANCKNVITVGAIGPDGRRAPYSNYGSRIDVMAPGGDSSLKIKVGTTELPGGILSTVADDTAPGTYGYALLDGTSMAAPHVAGLIALMKGEQPDLTVSQALAKLKATSTPLSSAACRVSGGCGAGLVNAAAALTGTAPTPTPTPTPAPTPAPLPTPVGEIKTYVAALYQLANGFDGDRSQIVVVDQKTLRNPYLLSGLVAGSYQVAGWQDLNGNQKVDTGEPFGIYVNPSTGNPGLSIDAVARSILGINVQLRPLQASSAANLPVTQAASQAAVRRALETAASQAR